MRLSHWFVLIVLLMLPLSLLAQTGEGEEGYSNDPYADPTVAPLIVPMVTDFAPEAGPAYVAPASGDLGVSSYIEFSDKQKSGLLTPFYRLSPSLALKARVPLILSKKVEFFGTEGKASGLGDVSLEAEYSKIRSAGEILSLSLSVKLPTGDDEKLDNGIAVPLGTGVMDYYGKAQYAKSQPDFGWVASAVFRKSSGNDYEPGWGNLATITNTSGNQMIGSVFARKRAGQKFWLHLGASANLIGDGTKKSEYNDGTATLEEDVESGGTVIDLYPGVSYALGMLNPFLGVRVPLSTSWNNDMASTDRDTAVIFQFTYRPGRMAGN